MKQSEKAQAFLQSIDPESLKVGDGSDGLPVWVGVDAEAQKVYKVYANGIALGFGNGVMVNRLGVGARAGMPIEQSTIDRHVMLKYGEGMAERMELVELRA